MSVEHNPTRARRATVHLLQKALALLPMRLLVPLRYAYARAHPSDPRGRKMLGKLLSVVRVRAITGVREFELADAPDLRFVNVDSQIVQLVYWFGQTGYEPGEAAFWRRACTQAHGILEMGANVGYYTVLGASAARGTKYVAVEPLPANVSAFRANVALNNLDVEVVEAAVVGQPRSEPITLMLPDLHRWAASTGAYVKGAQVGDRVASRSVEVPAVVAETLVDGIDLVKIDIEGFEYDVLAPIRHWLRSAQPVLFIEVLDHSQELRDLLADLVDDGFGAWALTGTSPTAIDSETLRCRSLKGDFGTRDVVLAPPAKAPGLGLPAR